MFKIGDKVKFLNDVGGGKISRVLDKNMVYVENEDGFDIPVRISEIISDGEPQSSVDSGASTPRRTEPRNEGHRPLQEIIIAGKEDDSVVIIEGNDDPDFYLAFVPEDAAQPGSSAVRVYLINDSNSYLLYHYSHLKEKQYETRDAGKLEPNTKLLLEQLASSELGNLPVFCFQCIYYSHQSNRLEIPVKKQITVSSVKFYKSGSFRQSQFFEEKAMLFKLNETVMDKAVRELTEKDVKNVIYQKEPARKKQVVTETPELVEVDLHIDELLDSTAGLSNKDMMEMQMGTFRKNMEEAISDQKVKKIVFIHGLGSGVLKRELRRELASKYRKYSFQDASFQEYGYGATMVIIRKK